MPILTQGTKQNPTVFAALTVTINCNTVTAQCSKIVSPNHEAFLCAPSRLCLEQLSSWKESLLARGGPSPPRTQKTFCIHGHRGKQGNDCSTFSLGVGGAAGGLGGGMVCNVRFSQLLLKRALRFGGWEAVLCRTVQVSEAF